MLFELMKNIEVLGDELVRLREFEDNFRKWQQSFPCPKCKTPTMDFLIGTWKNPYICTKCHTFFDLKAVTNGSET